MKSAHYIKISSSFEIKGTNKTHAHKSAGQKKTNIKMKPKNKFAQCDVMHCNALAYEHICTQTRTTHLFVLSVSMGMDMAYGEWVCEWGAHIVHRCHFKEHSKVNSVAVLFVVVTARRYIPSTV